MKSQIVTLRQSSHEINGSNAQTFLSLSTNFNDSDSNNNMANNLNTNNNYKTNQFIMPANFSNLTDSSVLYKWFITM